MALTVISGILGFVREIVLAYFYGASSVSDAYLISLTIPTVIFAFIGVALKTTYIPIFIKIENEQGIDAANKFTNNIVNLLLVFSTFIILPVLIFTEPVVKLFASGFNEKTLALAISFTQISMLSIYIIGILYVFEGYLRIKKNFLIPGIISLPLNITIILSIVLSVGFDDRILAVGRVVAVIAQLLFVIPCLLKNGYKYTFYLNIRDNNLQKTLLLAIPVILGTSVNQINKLVDRTIASQVAIGGITALNYASRINGFVLNIFVTSLITVIYPIFSTLAANNNIKGLKRALAEAINIISLLILPATIGTMIFSESIITLLFARGAFGAKASALTASALFFYSIGLMGFGLREILSRALYSLNDTKSPMINAAIGMVLNIILNIILSKYLGIGGLALATSLSAIFTTGLMFITLRKKIGPLGIKQNCVSFFKVLVASLIMAVFAKLSFNYAATILSQNISLILAAGVGMLTYFIIIYFMKIEDVDKIVDYIQKKFRQTKF
jgi:putative peptidoglycan lipid II flippase